ncbi:hypothetical protein JCM10914_4638 [Paenibacillus sp. JCM 10914]|nr:hypothetical protein JCM10914_4638 [Paenibacillus sp. JCM 10914]
MHESGPNFGKWVAGTRTKWVTLGVWVLVALVLNLAWPAVGEYENNNAPNLREDVPSVVAEALADKEFPGNAGVPALIVWHKQSGLSDDDLGQLQALSADLEASPIPYQQFVVPFHQLPLQALRAELSEDQSTLVMPVFFEEDRDTELLEEGMSELQTRTESLMGADPFQTAINSEDQLSARVTGPVGISIDATGLFADADVSLMIATVLLVLILLLLIYRSPILALIPLVGVGFAYMVTSPILGMMAKEGWITVDSQAIAIMTVLLFGAGTDYCLFLISRFRQLLWHEPDKRKALFRAITTSSGAIAMSGFTVVLSLFALLLAQYGAYQRFAVPFSLSILIMFIASLTLVPAILAIIGRGSFYPFIPRTQDMEASRAKKKGKPVPAPRKEKESWIGRLVITKPWTVVLVALVLLGGLATFSSQIKFTYDLLSSFPEDVPSREGFKLIGEQFSEGELAPVRVMVDSDGKSLDLADRLASLEYVDVVSEPQTGAVNNRIISYEIELAMNPYSMEAMQHIPDLKAVAAASLEVAGVANPDEAVWISGQTAMQYDTELAGEHDARLIIPVVIGLITILLLVYLRSIVATVYLIATVILSYFSALGLGWIIIHHGLGADAIQGAIPLYSFVFLVALGEDTTSS